MGSSAKAQSVADKWALNYQLGIEIPTDLNSLAALMRCAYGPLFSFHLRFEQIRDQGGAMRGEGEIYLPLQLQTSPSTVWRSGMGLVYADQTTSFAAMIGVDFYPVESLRLRTQFSALPTIDRYFVSQGFDYQFRSSQKRRDYIGFRYELLRRQGELGELREPRYLLATGSEF